MKKKRFVAICATCLATAVGGYAFIGGYKPLIKANATVVDTLRVGVDEPMNGLNIFTATKLTDVTSAVFTMTYDTLLTLDSNGNLQPGLVEEWFPSEETGDNEWTYEVPEYIEDNWGTILPPGWEKLPPYLEGEQFVAQSGDGLSGGTVYFLREGVRFHDGSYLTAQSIADLVAFSKTLPTDTLLYKQWSCVSTVNVLEEYSFSFSLNLANCTGGNMDFTYGLASPMGSIVSVEGLTSETLPTFAMGTGAYKESGTVSVNQVQLEKNPYWWNAINPVSTPNITFYYNQTAVLMEDMIQGNNALSIIRGDTNTITSLIETNTVHYSRYKSLPYAITFNLDNGLFRGISARKAVALTVDKDNFLGSADLENLANIASLAKSSNGIWCYLTDLLEWHYPNITPEDGESLAIPTETERATVIEALWDASIVEELGEIKIVVYNSSCFASESSTSYTYYAQMVNTIKNDLETKLNTIYGEDSVSVQVIETTESGMKMYEQTGNYDMMIKEIDYSNINSAYNMLYGKVSDNVDEMLTAVKYAKDGNTFAKLHAAVQWEALGARTLINLGWQKKLVVQNLNVEGCMDPQGRGFTPFGYIAGIDLRWIKIET